MLPSYPAEPNESHEYLVRYGIVAITCKSRIHMRTNRPNQTIPLFSPCRVDSVGRARSELVYGVRQLVLRVHAGFHFSRPGAVLRPVSERIRTVPLAGRVRRVFDSDWPFWDVHGRVSLHE